jgi:hypothetical protein
MERMAYGINGRREGKRKKEGKYLQVALLAFSSLPQAKEGGGGGGGSPSNISPIVLV